MDSLLRCLYNALKSMPMPPFINHIIFGTPRLKQLPRASVQSLPNEIFLEIFSFLELKPYILCHGVCKKWLHLLPSAQMDPIRRRLLDLYRRIIHTHDFEKTLEWTEQHIQSFDREEYIRSLLTQHPVIPEEFRMWILEWPARLVINCIWPGLPFFNCRTISEVVRRTGTNWIAYRSFSPQLSSLVYKHETSSQTYIPGLYIWSWATLTDWLIFEQDEPELFGRVYIINAYYHSPGSIPYYPPRQEIGDQDDDDDEDTDSEYSEGEEHVVFFDDWISYLEYSRIETAYRILHPTQIHLRPDLPIDQPISYLFAAPGDETLPASRWDPASVHY